MAMASSYVSSLRFSISAVGRPKFITSIWNANTMFDPICCTMFCTLLFSPRTTEEIVITVVTPITIPRIVNPERILLRTSVVNASRNISLKSPRDAIRFLPLSCTCSYCCSLLLFFAFVLCFYGVILSEAKDLGVAVAPSLNLAKLRPPRETFLQLKSQRRNRVQLRRLPCRIHPEKHAHR